MTSIFISPPSFNDFVVKNKGNDIPVGNSKTDMCHYRTRFPGRKKSMMHIYELCTFRCLKKSSEVHNIILHNCLMAYLF